MNFNSQGNYQLASYSPPVYSIYKSEGNNDLVLDYHKNSLVKEKKFNQNQLSTPTNSQQIISFQNSN